jgi:Cupin-like domain
MLQNVMVTQNIMETTIKHTPMRTNGRWETVEPAEQCRQAMHKRSFRAVHPLAGHPLFSVDALIGAAKAAAKRPGDLYADAGDVKVTDKWGHIPMPDRPVEEVLRRIEHAGAWIIMKHVESDPAYAEVLNEFADFVRSLSAPDQRYTLNNPEMLVPITSPKRVTPFHFDAEVNFLVQIQGVKHVWVCDPNDRTAVTDEEIERYYAGQQNAGTYKPGVEARATRYDLNPGEAVHIPTHAAHWVENGDNISVSLSLNFELPPSLFKYVSITNHGLRRLGLKPRPPGMSKACDRLKALAGGVAFNGHEFWKRIRSGKHT